MEISSVIFALLAGAFWAMAQLSGKVALKNINSWGLNTLRFSIFLPLTFLNLIFFDKLKLPPFNTWPLIILTGIIGWCLGSQIYFYILEREQMHRIVPIGNSYPALVVIFSVIFLKEKPSLLIIPIFLLLLSGIYLLNPQDGSKKYKWGISLGILVAFLWAIAMVLTKNFLYSYTTTQVLFLKVLGATIFLYILSFYFRFKINLEGVFFSLLSGIFIFLGEFSYMIALKDSYASYVAPFCNTVIPFGFLFSVIFLKEKPDFKKYLGMIFMFFAVILSIYL